MKITSSMLLNIVLVTVLATSLFFISTTASTAEYNPWSDIDGDGDIDIYDVVKVTGIYGSLGDPTRNVNVTNWPLDQNGNLKVTAFDESRVFPDLLVLAGGIMSMINGSSECVLFDYYSPFPEMASKWVRNLGGNQPSFVTVFNSRFIYGGYPIATCNIKGRIVGALTVTAYGRHINDYTYFKGHLDFEKILSNGSTVTLFSEELNQKGISGPSNATWSLAYAFSVEEPIAVSSDERISIRIFIEAKWYSTYGNQLWIHFNTEPDDFMVIIPIAP